MTTDAERAAAIQAVLAAGKPVFRPPRKTVPSTTLANRAHTARVKAAGRKQTTVIYSPDAAARVAGLMASGLFASQSDAVSAALTGPEVHALSPAATAAIAQLRHDWELASDAAVIDLAVRWLEHHVRTNNVQRLRF